MIHGIQSVEKLRWRLAQFPIPQDLRGKRVLDIGAWDGWFSFEMERRGAQVLAIDNARRTRFLKAREILGSKVDYQIADICRVTARDFGRFDIVLFFGVLYHLKHPLRALETVCDLATDMALVESYVTDDGSQPDAPPVMEFYETTEFLGQFDNWVGPNTSCLLAFCRTAGFARVALESVSDFRAHVICNRKWAEVARTGAAPELIVVENSELLNHTFSAHRDDYVTVWIHRDEPDLTCDDICVQIGPYGARPAAVANVGAAWQANCKLPLGLAPGWYDVSVSVRSSEWSNRARIAVDLPSEAQICTPTTRDFEISIVCDGRTWERNQVRTGLGSCLSAWVGGLPDGLQRTEVSFRLNGTDLPCCYVSPVDDGKGKQVNAMVPAGLDRGAYQLSLRCRNEESQPVTIQLF